MTVTDWVFIVVAAITLVAAYRVVMSQKIMHAALWLGLTFVGVAGIFVILGAEFLAAAQILIYVGAITTIIIFGIMLSAVEDLRGKFGESMWERLKVQFQTPRRGILALVAGVGFSLLMLVLLRGGVWPAPPPALEGNNPRFLGEVLFTRFIVPFEVASIVLLVALIGAIVLAMKEEESE